MLADSRGAAIVTAFTREQAAKRENEGPWGAAAVKQCIAGVSGGLDAGASAEDGQVQVYTCPCLHSRD